MYRDYYNYVNNNYNKPLFEDTNKLFDPYNGFIRGNLFPQLYNTYDNKEPFQIKPNNEQAEMLTYIDSIQFALIDLNLHLDVNPDDRDAIKLFNKYRDTYNDYVTNYENKYGPLTLNSASLNTYPWAWNNMPWPWDNR